jgi:hypothetical protein
MHGLWEAWFFSVQETGPKQSSLRNKLQRQGKGSKGTKREQAPLPSYIRVTWRADSLAPWRVVIRPAVIVPSGPWSSHLQSCRSQAIASGKKRWFWIKRPVSHKWMEHWILRDGTVAVWAFHLTLVKSVVGQKTERIPLVRREPRLPCCTQQMGDSL